MDNKITEFWEKIGNDLLINYKEECKYCEEKENLKLRGDVLMCQECIEQDEKETCHFCFETENLNFVGDVLLCEECQEEEIKKLPNCEECDYRKQDKAGLVWNNMSLCEPCYAQYDAERLGLYDECEPCPCSDCGEIHPFSECEN